MTRELHEELQWRGLIQDISDPELFQKLPPGAGVYGGFDPTAPSLHHGNLQVITNLVRFGKAGYKPIALFGGATGAIGDPKATTERPLLSREEIDHNVALHGKRVRELLGRAGVDASFVNNFDWFRDISFINFLRDVGKFITVNYMLHKEVVKSRIEGDGMSYTEFSYMLLQANDFLHLYQHHNCRVQIGGSDQWGNITAGLELIRKKISGDAFAMSSPLLLDSTGKKLGKSEGGAVWLDPNYLSPYRFHQYFLNTPDADVILVLKRFSFLTREAIAALETELKEHPEKRVAQQALADEMCDFVHGKEATAQARRSAEVLFGGSIAGLSDEQLEEIFKEVPSSTRPRAEVGQSSIPDLFATAGLCKSKGEARRLIESGGAYINNERISDTALLLEGTQHLARSVLLLRAGKKSYHLLKLL